MFINWNLDVVIDEILQQALQKYPPSIESQESTRQKTIQLIREMHVKFTDWLNVRELNEVKNELERYKEDYMGCFGALSAEGYNYPDTRSNNLKNGNLFEYFSCIVYVKRMLESVQNGESTVFERTGLKNLPQKILLLEKLGFFGLPEVQGLSYESKGKLVSALCGGSADNAVDYIRQCDPKRTALEKNPYRNKVNVNAVQELLNSLNRD